MSTPSTADDQHQQGLKRLSQGKPAEAEPFFRAAVGERPDWAEAHNNLGFALAARGQLPEARESFRQAVQLQPDYPDAHHNLGNNLRHSGLAAEALDHYRTAVQLRPNWPDPYNNMGVALRSLGQQDEALECFRQALRLKPQHIEARNNLGVALSDKGLHREAASAYRQVLRYKPKAADAHNNLGVVLAQLNRRTEAIACYRRALELQPNYADAYNNLGNSLRHEGFLEEAETSLRKALQLKPVYAEAYNNLAIILVKMERMEEAIANYQQALRLKPDYPDARKNLSLALLGLGKLAEGWPEYEYRWKTKEMPGRKLAQPAWDGSSPEGKTILLYAEQGMGDTIQFIRYAALIEKRGGKVLFECQKALLRLMARTPGIFRLVAQGEELPEFDTHAPLMSLPGLMGTTSLETIPAPVPYVVADPERLRKWGDELRGITGFKIGIAWQGSQKYGDDKFRSIPLIHFAPITKLPGVRLINLQVGFGSEQLRQVPSWKVIDFGKKLDEKGGFLDTAALMKHLDLMITSDSAVAHLAGALGIPVWMATSRAPDWRWLLAGESNPWYPTMRLFRQKKHGDWADVFERMALELEKVPALETAERHTQRGLALLNKGKGAEAAAALRRALDLEPKNAVLHNNLAVAWDKEGKKNEALEGFREAVRLKPDYVEALHNLANHLRRLNRPAEAVVEYRKALQAAPNAHDLCNHLGIALLGQANHKEAEACFRRSLRLNPDNAEAHNNLGVLCEQMGNLDEAIACYQEAIRLKPEATDFHKNLALGWLMRGVYARGWAEYEWRWKGPGGSRNFAQPRWDGRHLDGQGVLIWAEQGLGDTIQFIRYAALVQQRGGVTLVECPGILEKLLSRCPGIDRLIPQNAPLPDFAFQVPFLSLPGIFHTTLETVPAPVPYLSADPDRSDAWARELEPLSGFKIGIAWQGSQKYGGDPHRSIPLKEFEPLATLPGVRLISLQKGYGTEQLQELGQRWNVVDFGERLDAEGAFLDSAAILSQLDLLVACDTAVAHLAGALGVPVWLPLCRAADWRWLREGELSPWYPTLRLFRQTSWGDWAGVFQRMAQELRQTRLSQAPAIQTEIAPGELLDKITILEIKRSRTTNEQKLHHVRVELGSLMVARARSLKSSPELDELTGQLKAVNMQLWQIEDDIRVQGKRQAFDERFIDLARSVYVNNDRRSEIKRAINQLLGSRIVEVKSYEQDQEPVTESVPLHETPPVPDRESETCNSTRQLA